VVHTGQCAFLIVEIRISCKVENERIIAKTGIGCQGLIIWKRYGGSDINGCLDQQKVNNSQLCLR
jgi:hypothetical protein